MDVNDISVDSFLKFARSDKIDGDAEFSQTNVTKLSEGVDAKGHTISRSARRSEVNRRMTLWMLER